MDSAGKAESRETEESFAKELWFQSLRSYLEGQGEPHDICLMRDTIESIFEPDWLGDMWNACDWAPNDRHLAPQIAEEAQTILAQYCEN